MFLILFELKGNFTDSTVWNNGETGDMNYKNNPNLPAIHIPPEVHWQVEQKQNNQHL